MLLPAVVMTKSKIANRLFFKHNECARSLVTIVVYSHRAIIQHGTHAYTLRFVHIYHMYITI